MNSWRPPERDFTGSLLDQIDLFLWFSDGRCILRARSSPKMNSSSEESVAVNPFRTFPPAPPSLCRLYAPALLAHLLFVTLTVCAAATTSVRLVVHRPAEKTITLTDGAGQLTLVLDYAQGATLREVYAGGDEILGQGGLVWTGGEVGDTAMSSLVSTPPVVACTESGATVAGIRPGGSTSAMEERWFFFPRPRGIQWRIERTYHEAVELHQVLTPCWEFQPFSRWTGALLGTGGVAWFRLFDTSGATYGVHTDRITLWRNDKPFALRIAASSPTGDQVAVRLSRERDSVLSIGWSVTDRELGYRYDQGTRRRRFLTRRTDVWTPVTQQQETVTVDFDITSLNFRDEYGLGDITHFRQASLEAFCQTVSRIGVIDAGLHGSNSWRTPYGPVCLHEPFIAQLGLIMQDPDYCRSYQRTLDGYRDHAIEPDGRVKSRWAYTCEDAMPGTCDSLGFYEAQWGYLMDSNPDYVTNVAELFDFTGNWQWLRGQKSSCERVLEYMLRRDSDGDGLVEMMTDNHTDAKGSDWIDIIWAAHENAFVNAKTYNALMLWASCEELLADQPSARRYRDAAARLKKSFNRSTAKGGLWDKKNRWYVHWRDKDGSIHGNNLVTFVNFQAIAYGVCDDPNRRRAILDRIEREMQRENLFFWPICLYSYARGEGLSWQWPFPNYENGDIFLSLGEVATRAYAGYKPSVAVKYVERLLAQYERDGLAFQRYRRTDQKGAGDDILAGNALGVVGLFRNVYGIQPKYNRLYIEPHITPDLYGTRLDYRLRGQKYQITYDSAGTLVTTGNTTIRCREAFGINSSKSSIEFFFGRVATPAMTLGEPSGTLLVTVEAWQPRRKAWTAMGGETEYRIGNLKQGAVFHLLVDGKREMELSSDAAGTVVFRSKVGRPGRTRFVLTGE